MQKTKMQQLFEAPKGFTEYNPNQSFMLQVYWIIRSPKALNEMIEQGFFPCARCTERDTPTTLAYFFRISRDQQLAAQFKETVKKIGDHPHYLSAFKSMNMGIPRPAIEMKLRQGGIDITPLSWGAEEPISGHEKEIDFDPVILECTEIYLDNRSFFQHAASQEWMKGHSQITKLGRSLKATTYCIGTPTEDVYQNPLESTYNVIDFIHDERKLIKEIKPEISFIQFENNQTIQCLFFMELDLNINNSNVSEYRSNLSSMQNELKAPLMIVFPTNMSEKESEPDHLEVRIMFSIPYSENLKSDYFKFIFTNSTKFEGRIIVFDDNNNGEQKNIEYATQFIQNSGLDLATFIIIDAQKAKDDKLLAGYPLHPLYHTLTKNDTINYKP